VPQGSVGLRQGPEALTMGMRGMVQNTIFLEGVPVSSAQLLGAPGAGMSVAQDAMMQGRLGLAAGCLGGMKRCAQLMVRYSSRRTVASGRLLDNAVTQVRLQNLTNAIAALETLVFTVADLIDQGIEVPEEAYIACKTIGPEFFWQSADHLVQLMGGRGYIETNIAPQMLRDARVFRIFEGPTETLNMFLGSRVLHKGEGLYQFFSQTLGVPTVVQQLQQAVKNIQTHLIDASDRSFQGRATQWAYTCIGEISALAILLATVQSANERAKSSALSRAHAWVEKQFEEKLAQILNTPAAIRIDLSAQTLCDEIAGYQSSIGEVTQQAIGENHSLDELLKVSVSTESTLNPSDNSAEQQQDSPIAESGAQLPYTAEILQGWIENWLSQTLNIEQSLDHNVSFADYGIDSVMAVELIHDLEDWLQHTLDVTALWNFPTIKTLAEHLVSELGAQITDLQSASSASQLSSPKTSPVNFKDAQEDSMATSIERELGALEDLLGA
ncbi:MAG: acyl-CoA dehydrogenase family protein, partial [Cyanobacteria bacterium J06576_12]